MTSRGDRWKATQVHWTREQRDWFARTPKRVLAAMVKEYAARLTGDSFETSLEDGSWFETAKADAATWE